ASPAFYLIFLLYLVSFVLIPGSLGAVGAILVANYFPRRQRLVLGIAVAAFLAMAIVLAVRLFRTPGETLSSDWMGGLLGRLAFSQHPLWPSRWMSAGLVASARGNWSDGLFYLMVPTRQSRNQIG
ncbi:MAG: hypothetical protein JO116_07640, partial [Planctomycetaceae bacterium]|nr:hypothetical protein [Planctomycetaceae bacterium]